MLVLMSCYSHGTFGVFGSRKGVRLYFRHRFICYLDQVRASCLNVQSVLADFHDETLPCRYASHPGSVPRVLRSVQRRHNVDVATGLSSNGVTQTGMLRAQASMTQFFRTDISLQRSFERCRFRSHCTAMSRFAFLGWVLLPFLAAATLGQSTVALEDSTASRPQKVLVDDYRVTCENIAKSVSPASQVFYPGMFLSSLYSGRPVGGGSFMIYL